MPLLKSVTFYTTTRFCLLSIPTVLGMSMNPFLVSVSLLLATLSYNWLSTPNMTLWLRRGQARKTRFAGCIAWWAVYMFLAYAEKRKRRFCKDCNDETDRTGITVRRLQVAK